MRRPRRRCYLHGTEQLMLTISSGTAAAQENFIGKQLQLLTQKLCVEPIESQIWHVLLSSQQPAIYCCLGITNVQLSQPDLVRYNSYIWLPSRYSGCWRPLQAPTKFFRSGNGGGESQRCFPDGSGGNKRNSFALRQNRSHLDSVGSVGSVISQMQCNFLKVSGNAFPPGVASGIQTGQVIAAQYGHSSFSNTATVKAATVPRAASTM